MKYFTSELWDLINSENEEVRQQAELNGMKIHNSIIIILIVQLKKD